MKNAIKRIFQKFQIVLKGKIFYFLFYLYRSRVGSPTMSATVAGTQQQQHPHQEWDINDRSF